MSNTVKTGQEKIWAEISHGECFADCLMGKFQVDMVPIEDLRKLCKNLLICRLVEENPDNIPTGRAKIATRYMQRQAEFILQRNASKLQPIRREREFATPEEEEITITFNHSQWKRAM
jgi:hypothetical protein